MDTGIVANDNLLMSYFEAKALETLKAEVGFYNIAEKKPLPKGSGQSMTWNAWRPIGAASATLSEYAASANAAVRLSSRKVNVTIQSFGRAIQLTDTLELTSILPVEPGALEQLEQSAVLTTDNIVQLCVFKNVLAQVGTNADTQTKILSAFLSATASSFCANTGTTGNSRQFGFPVVFGMSCVISALPAASAAANASISARMGPIAVRKAVARLKRLNVPPMANGKYVGVAHPAAISTMLGNSDYKAWLTGYVEGPRETMYKHKVATVHNVDFIESSNVPRFVGAGARGKVIDLTFIAGKGAVAVTELDGGVKMIIKRPGPQSTDNPFDLFSTLSYKVRAAAAAINPSCGVVLVTAEGKLEGTY